MLVSECKEQWEKIKADYAPKFQNFGISLEINYGFEDEKCEETIEKAEDSTAFFASVLLVDPTLEKNMSYCCLWEDYLIDGDSVVSYDEDGEISFEEDTSVLDTLLTKIAEAENPHEAFKKEVIAKDKEAKARMKEIMRDMVPWWALKLALVLFVCALILSYIALKLSGGI